MIDLPSILYVEDEFGDALLMRLAFKRVGIRASLEIATDGQMAMDYLAGKGAFADRQRHPLPTLILLDLNLPGPSGFEVLQWVKQQPHLRHTPVVIFSSSERPDDRARALALGAQEFLGKPSGDGFGQVVVHLKEILLC